MKIYTQKPFLWLRLAAVLVLLLLAPGQISYAQESSLVVVSGKVVDQNTKEPLPGVSILIKGTVAGTSTNNKGEFSIRTRLRFPFTVVFNYIGFQQQEYVIKDASSKLNVELVTQTVLG